MVLVAEHPGADASPDGPSVVATALQAEVEFSLPHGYVDASGTVHRDGRMRLATARDELAPLVDPRVARNRAYLVVLLLARVVPAAQPRPARGATGLPALRRADPAGGVRPGGSAGHPSHVTVEEVATLASRFGWGYESLMAMSGAERRLWLAAAGRLGRLGASASASPPAPAVAAAPATPAAPRMATDAERRARLMELHDELNRKRR
jgi:hypothetical protein